MSLLEILTLLFKRKKAIIGIFLLLFISAAAYTLAQDPTYEAKATILVKMFREDPSRPGMEADANNLPRIVSQDEVVNAEIQILTGRELAEKVIGTLKMERIYPSLASGELVPTARIDQAVQNFAQSLQVQGVRKSNVIAVSFQHNDPEIAAKAVNLLIEAFKEKHLAVHSDPQSSFIAGQLAAFEGKLKESEKQLQDYQQRTGVYSIDEQKTLLLRQRTELDSAYRQAVTNVRENQDKIGSLKLQMKYITDNKDRYTQTERDRIIIEAKSKLLELQLKEQELKMKYTDKNKLLADTRKELEVVSKFMKDQEEIIVGKVKTANPVYQSMETDLFRVQADLKSQTARAEALKAQLRQLDREIATLDRSQNQIQDLKRQIALNEKNYMAYMERNEDARISGAMNRLKLSNISVIQQAVAPVKPIKPNKSMSLALGMAFGMAAGLLYAYAAERLCQTFTDPKGVEKYLGLPVLVTVPLKKG